MMAFFYSNEMLRSSKAAESGRLRPRACAQVLACLSIAIATSLLGSAHASTFAGAEVFISGVDTISQQSTVPGMPATANISATGPFGGGAIASAAAIALPGHLRVISQSSATTGTNVQATATAQWSEAFSIESPALTGTLGSMTGSFAIGGGLSSQFFSGIPHTIGSSVIANLTVSQSVNGGTFIQQGGGRIVLPGDGAVEGLENFTLGFVDLPFIYGQPIGISVRIIAATGVDVANTAGISGSGSATADYSHSMTWQGLTSVRDSNGNLVTNFTAIGNSGFDFASPVPEPGTWGMAIAGMLLFAWRRPRWVSQKQ